MLSIYTKHFFIAFGVIYTTIVIVCISEGDNAVGTGEEKLTDKKSLVTTKGLPFAQLSSIIFHCSVI